MRIAREQLLFLCLVALDEVVQHCMTEPHPRGFTLRATLATLYALGDGQRAPFDAFWQACAVPNREACEIYGGRTRRVNELGSAYHSICRALGCAETIDLCADIRAARSDPGPHARAYERVHRQDTPETERRRRYAEMLRMTSSRQG